MGWNHLFQNVAWRFQHNADRVCCLLHFTSAPSPFPWSTYRSVSGRACPWVHLSVSSKHTAALSSKMRFCLKLERANRALYNFQLCILSIFTALFPCLLLWQVGPGACLSSVLVLLPLCGQSWAGVSGVPVPAESWHPTRDSPPRPCERAAAEFDGFFICVGAAAGDTCGNKGPLCWVGLRLGKNNKQPLSQLLI